MEIDGYCGSPNPYACKEEAAAERTYRTIRPAHQVPAQSEPKASASTDSYVEAAKNWTVEKINTVRSWLGQ